MSKNEFIFNMVGLSKTYPGGKKVLDNVYLSFFPDAKIGIVGPNGAGKSTLLKIMAGQITEFNGEAFPAKDATVGYLPQEPQLDPEKTVKENIMEGLGAVVEHLKEYNDISAKFAEPDADFDALLARQGELQELIEANDGWNIETTLNMAMEALRCPPGDSKVTHLSGGEKRRVALCKLLLEKPDLLLLDEPTNHLDAETVAWLQRHLVDYPGAVVMVTHDRYFLDSVTGWILELDRGSGIPYEGNYSAYLENKAKRLEQEGREQEARKKTLARELEWVRQSPKARQAKSKARISAYDELLAESQKHEKTRNAQIVIPVPPRLGSKVVEFENVDKGYDDRLLIDGLSFRLPAGGIVGVIGPNGAGKTTTFRMITGQEDPNNGNVSIGETVELGYVDQSRDSLDDSKSVWEEISGGDELILLGKKEMQSRAYVSSFGFRGPDQQKKLGVLSGGERNRVHLAKMLRKESNVLLLDEPTNDLDTETLSALEEALESFAGCAVVISHDRWFLDRLATHILAFEGNSEVVWFEGNYEDYEADKRRRLGGDADQPTRIKYKPLRKAG